jgi:O-antigen/teichoic acid export membrane protein
MLSLISEFKYKIGINKQILNYVSSSLISVPISLFTGLITFSSINPELLGMWAGVSIFQSYSTFISLGIVNGLNRELPIALGRNNKDEANKYASNVLSYTVFQFVIYLVGLVIFLLTNTSTYYYKICITVLVIKLIMAVYMQYLESTFRSNDDFVVLSKVQWISALIRLLSCPLIYFGFEYYLIYLVLFDLSRLVLMHYWRPFKVNMAFQFNNFCKLFRTGFPLFLLTYFSGIINTLPNLFILSYGNEYYLGLFAPVLLLASVFEQFISAISNYLSPRVMYAFGSGENIMDIFNRVNKTILILLLSLTVAAIILIIPFGYFGVLFPKYEGSSKYIQLILMIVPFYTYVLYGQFWVLTKNFKLMYSALALRFILYASLASLFYYIIKLDILIVVISTLFCSHIILWIFYNQKTKQVIKKQFDDKL